MTHTILCLVGPSGAGKTTIATEMQTLSKIRQVVSYTTRPMRDGELNGREHFFIDEPEAARLLYKFRPMAHTVFGGHLYFALFSQVCEHATPTFTYVIDEYGLMELQANVDDMNDRLRLEYGLAGADRIDLLPIYIERDADRIASDIDANRADRDRGREVLPLSFYSLHVINDAPDAATLRIWASDFAQAITAMLTVTPARDIAARTDVSTIRTSITGVANIIASINDAWHK